MDIAQIKRVTGAWMKAQEVLFVAAGVKPCGRQGYYDSELDAFLQMLKTLGLFFEISRFRVSLEDSDSFSNKGKVTNEKHGMRFVYFAKDQLVASYAALAEAQGDVAALGSLLGYPSCCVQYFKSHFTPEHTDLQLVSSDWRLNLSRRGEDCCLLSHFPCGAQCASSIIIADAYFACLSSHNAVYANTLKKNLLPGPHSV
ncbi:MAG TPA: hypothetical protein VK158_05120 [Acidobacteriota bacterium]|nr:hypothetical protein [Acidobacteriota bacterium]